MPKCIPSETARPNLYGQGKRPPMTRGIIFNIQRYSIQDGPGIRTTVFLKGCPLRCWWCHNPEGQKKQAELALTPERCIGCGSCVEFCQNAPFSADGDGPCRRCGDCADVCPTGARERIGREMTPAQVLEEVLKDRPFYDESGGGVTFSGGEPLMQPDFLLECLEACGRYGIHRAVDTSGYATPDLIRLVAARTELFLYDLKFVDEDRHRRHTGVSSRLILNNLLLLDELDVEVWVRIPVIPGINDGDDILQMADFLASLRRIRRVHLLPYHRTGADKYRRLGRSYRLGRLMPPSKERMEKLAEPFRRRGLDIRLGG